MTETGHLVADVLQSSTDWTWTIVGLGFVLLSFALYKLCVKQTVAINGRVKTTITLPALLTTHIKLQPDIKLFRQSRARRDALSPQQILWFGQLYNGQEIVFGVLLYLFGLTLISKGGASVFGTVEYANNAVPLLLVCIGLFAALWGVVTVVKRHQRNPFTQPIKTGSDLR